MVKLGSYWGHVDHIGACITHARSKALRGYHSTYYVPSQCVGPLKDAQKAFSSLDGHDIPMEIESLGKKGILIRE